MTRRRLYLSVVFMLLAIAAVAAFQVYWLTKNFKEEKEELTFRANVLFRDAIEQVQSEKLKLNGFDSNVRYKVVRYGSVGLINAIKKRKIEDTLRHAKQVQVFYNDTVKVIRPNTPGAPGAIHSVEIRDAPLPEIFAKLVDSLQDSITVTDIQHKYEQLLQQEKFPVSFLITSRHVVSEEKALLPNLENNDEVILGFKRPVSYKILINNTTSFVLRKMFSQILVSVLLVGLTILSFSLLLRNLVQQHRLTQIKNDFISNITHELKTPIATVSVAIEALHKFGALHNAERTKEYLDISSNELQRLSMLVDKVLKLSMFEKQQIQLKEEQVNLAQLTNEVVTSMKLQFEKFKAQVHIQLHGNCFMVHADKLHITSVLFNLLDNALKYSKNHPAIQIELKEASTEVELHVTDNGVGIPAEYRKRIFDKFFRVPAGDTHNVKGYGLGLSYVAYVIQRHHGSIDVDSQPGIGSRFIIKLPAIT